MFDYHIHTDFSDDCFTPMEEMVEAAAQKGLKEIAVTDHYDPDYPDKDFPFEIDFPKYHKHLLECSEANKSRIRILKGIEIGIQHGDTLKKCEKAAGGFPYDIVIGAFHSVYGKALYLNYFDDVTIEQGVMDYYVYMRDCLRQFKNFDILGHINVIDRYADRLPCYSPYMEIIESILKALIDDGKGLESNASSYRYNMGERTIPALEILKMYKELGGEIITIGSDAHKGPQVGYGYEKAVDTLAACGFKYISTFEGRKVGFVKI